MVSRLPGGNAPDGVAWPWARFVADRDGQTHGYLMQRAKPGAMPPPYSDPASFRSCKLRKQRREISLKSRREIQVLMAGIVVRYAATMQKMHDYGYAVGDVNDTHCLTWILTQRS